MRISVDGTCRGNGKVYTRFDIADLAPTHSLAVRDARVAGSLVPGAIYEVKQAHSTGTLRRFVVHFPSSSIRRQPTPSTSSMLTERSLKLSV